MHAEILFSSALQCPPASCSAAVSGPVHWDHSLPAGAGVLSTGEYSKPWDRCTETLFKSLYEKKIYNTKSQLGILFWRSQFNLKGLIF